MAAEAPPAESPPAPPEEKDPESVMQDAADKARGAADKAGLKLPARGEAGVLVDELGETLLATLSAAQRDWLLVFTGWCRLSGKDSEGDRQRTALDMVLSLVAKCPPAFRTSEPCLVVMRNVTFPTLISTSVSQNLPVSEKSLQILFTLSKEFKEQLKPEIGVFIDEITLRILESGNSTFPHKRRALQVFCKYCEDTVSSLELFLNFDCNVDEKNIFERMIDCLSKIAQGKYTDPEHSAMILPPQEQELRTLALRALVKLMGELKEWLRKAAAEAPDAAGEASARSARASLSRAVSAEDQESTSDATDGHEPQSATNARAPTGTSERSIGDLSVCEQKQRKRDLQNGIHKFNLKPKRGLEHLRQGGFVNEKPQSVADLFKNGDLGLDKTAVGDFLGEDKDFNKNVLESLIASLGFAGSEIDAALRNFLAIFRLPGEAQKISRILEMFADKYLQDNPGKFSHVDCAFVLSFSLIMLQTDLHNPGVKKKMTKDDFINNNRKIDDGKDLDRSYLESLYDSIASNPMSLKEDEDAKSKLDSKAAQRPEERTKLFQKESKALASRSLELMAQRSVRRRSSAYVCARTTEHARPFFEVVCWPVLATLSVLLDMHDEQDIIKECMEGFKHCVRIAVNFDMQSQRDAIVASLAKFTYLTTIKEIKQKNLDCTKALLAIGISEGNGLGPAWKDVLHCVSQLERLQIIGDKSRQDHQYFEAEEGRTPATPAHGQALKRRATGNGMSAMVTMTPEDQQIELVNSESVASRIDKSQVEHIFERSQRLDSRAIVHFVTALRGVSKMELEIVKQPRIFALQKLVEVAMCNMSRPREVWLRIWDVLSRHFVEVAANHPNVRVGMYAIDSMKQLAKSFLEDDQLCASNLQVEFLKPFEVVMTKDRPAASREVRELIVSSISIVFTRIQNVRSGWKIVFNILRAAVQEPGNEAAPESAFAIMERVLESKWDYFVENFGDGVRALDAFASQANLDIAMKATVYLQKAAQCLVSDKRLQREGSPAASRRVAEDVAEHPTDMDNPLVAHWFLILRALSRLVGDPRPSLRGAGLTGVVHCLRDHGLVAFDEEMWRMVFKGVIKPLFEDVHQQLKEGDATLEKVLAEVVLRNVKELPPKRFARCLPEIFPLLSKLVSVGSPEVRQVVQDILLGQVQPLLTQAAPVTAEANGR